MRSAAVTVRRPGASRVPVSSSRALTQVGRLNRSAKGARRDRRWAGKGASATRSIGWEERIPETESSRAHATRPRPAADRIARLAFVRQTVGRSSPARSLALPPPDPIGDRIAAAFSAFEIRKIRGGYPLAEPRTGRPVARIKPLPDTYRFESFYWSRARQRWKTFGPFGSMRLKYDEVADIIQNDPMFRIRRKGFIASLFG